MRDTHSKVSIRLSFDETSFISKFGSIYEHSPWVAEEAFQILNNLDVDFQSVVDVMKNCVERASIEQKTKLLNAHPELADRVAIAGDLTHESRTEQSGAGLTECSPEEFDLFQTLNQQYRSNFGFPFIVAVAGLSKTEILQIFQSRLDNRKDDEFSEAIKQVHLIAKFRLKAFFNVD